jgi:hypothetical protein
VKIGTEPAALTERLTPDLASRLARIALAHVTREYPNKLDHVLRAPADLLSPRALHPVFYGSFDWHSCVHGYWLLARLYRRFSALPETAEIRHLFDAQVTAENVETEVAYLQQPMRGGFERPYGWAWLLMLAAELKQHASADGKRWSATLQPLAYAIAERFRAFLPKATYPVRSGTHASSAFALALVLDYARVAGDDALAELSQHKVRAWFGADTDCQAWEPGGEDFLSPALIEAECMQRALPHAEFQAWFARFLPRLGAGEPAALFQPAIVSDRSDGRIAHLDGLNLSRAWCWRSLAPTLDEPIRTGALDAAERHIEASLPHLADDYMGEHWLATFALLALEG